MLAKPSTGAPARFLPDLLSIRRRPSVKKSASINSTKRLATAPDTAILMRKPAKKSSNRPVAHEPVGDGVVTTKRNPKQSK